MFYKRVGYILHAYVIVKSVDPIVMLHKLVLLFLSRAFENHKDRDHAYILHLWNVKNVFSVSSPSLIHLLQKIVE